MIRTHYISSSSNNIAAVKQLASRLKSAWCLNHDWTKSFEPGAVFDPTTLTHLDLECAVRADVFIFLDSEHFSRGGMMEYGARLASGGSVIHVGCQDEYLFFQHQNVTHYKTIESFLSHHYE